MKTGSDGKNYLVLPAIHPQTNKAFFYQQPVKEAAQSLVERGYIKIGDDGVVPFDSLITDMAGNETSIGSLFEPFREDPPEGLARLFSDDSAGSAPTSPPPLPDKRGRNLKGTQFIDPETGHAYGDPFANE